MISGVIGNKISRDQAVFFRVGRVLGETMIQPKRTFAKYNRINNYTDTTKKGIWFSGITLL
jgi:hypothetical protein